MNRIIFFISIIFSIIFIGCKRNQYDLIYDTIGKRIEITDTINKDSTQFTILRYIDNPLCTSCQLKLGNDIVFLLDSTNTVLSIGNPNDNIKIDSLY